MEIIIGAIAGLITSWGMGGGALLIPLLSNFAGIEQHIAQATNLIFFIPTALCSVIINTKNRNVKYKLSFQIVIFGIIGTIIGSTISNKLDKIFLRKIFGILLMIMAFLEIYNFYKLYIKDENRHNNFKQHNHNIEKLPKNK